MLPQKYIIFSISIGIIFAIAYLLLSKPLGQNASNALLLFIITVAMSLLVSVALDTHSKLMKLNDKTMGMVNRVGKWIPDLGIKKKRRRS